MYLDGSNSWFGGVYSRGFHLVYRVSKAGFWLQIQLLSIGILLSQIVFTSLIHAIMLVLEISGLDFLFPDLVN